MTKKLVEACVEGASVLELCLLGDRLLEEGTGAVFNKAVKGVKVQKGKSFLLALPGLLKELGGAI